MQFFQPFWSKYRSFLIILTASILVLTACGLPFVPTQPAPPPAAPNTSSSPAVSTPSSTQDSPIPVEPSITAAPTVTPAPSQPQPEAADPLDCRRASPLVEDLLAQTSAETWLDWVRKLSGAEPVTVRGQAVTFTTRHTSSMFANPNTPSAFDFVHETVLGWYPEDQVAVQDFSEARGSGSEVKGKNLILTLPGAKRPEEIVILSAHLDSLNGAGDSQPAPGAEDNASGSAALLEAARLFRGVRFARTLQIVWFTGEEQGLLGSKAFTERLKDPQAVQGVINLDMFGYDSDSDRCFELHVGTLPKSNAVGACFVQSIQAYELDLPRHDYLTQGATGSSDHGRFWDAGIGAVEVLENLFNNKLPKGCPNADPSPHYHTANDTADRLNPLSAIEIVRAALAAAAGMAGVVE